MASVTVAAGDAAFAPAYGVAKRLIFVIVASATLAARAVIHVLLRSAQSAKPRREICYVIWAFVQIAVKAVILVLVMFAHSVGIRE